MTKMKRYLNKSTGMLSMIVAGAIFMAACGQSTASASSSDGDSTQITSVASSESEESVSTASGESETAVTVSADIQAESVEAATDESSADTTETSEDVTVTSGLLEGTKVFTARDMRQTADLSEAVTYTVTDGEDITITEEGVYVITGTASDVTIYVDAEDTDKVQIVLDGANITNSDTPCIYVIEADKVFVTTASESSLSVTGTFTEDEYGADAAIFSKSDLVLNGEGTLTITSTDVGIDGKDDLKVTGGTYNIESGTSAIEANDSIVIAGGTFVLNAGTDGLHAENNDDDTLGYIYISGGDFTISAGDDGIHGTPAVQIDGGTFTISAVEGIEATYVQINGGTFDIDATDDGINASSKSTAYAVTIEITGGDLTIDMGAGDTDGLDANGDLIISGGTISINCNSAVDYDGTGTLSGGTLIVNGEEVTELTQSMMMGGGMMGGGMRGGMNGGEMPDGEMPSGDMNGGNMPGGNGGMTPPGGGSRS